MQLLDFLNLGGGEIALLLFIAIPFLLIVYCIVDIVKSDFKGPTTKLLFLILVAVAPFIGSIIYLALKRNYIKQKPVNY